MRNALLICVATCVLFLASWLAGPWFLRLSGDMIEPRSEVHAAEIEGVIYVAGGIGFFRTLKSCAAFDTESHQFNECPDLPRSLHHVAMAAGNGVVFASGGYSSLPFVQDEEGALFALSPESEPGNWRELAALPHPLGQHAMVFHENALWLVGGESGGTTTGEFWRYDLASGEWEARAPMPTARHSHAVALEDGHLFVTGGRSEVLGSSSTVIEVYDFASDQWRPLPDAPFALGGHGAAVFEGRLHVFGGENIETGQVVADHASLDWGNPDAGWRNETPVAHPRHGFATARVGNTAWIIAGGKRAGLRTPWSVTGGALPLTLAN